MIRLLLGRAESLVFDHPRAVLAGAVALCAIALWLGSGIELLTSRDELVPEGDASQARWNALRAEFASAEPLIVALEASAGGVTVDDLEEAAGAIGRRLESHRLVRSVFYRIDLDWIADHALTLAPADKVERALEMIDSLSAADGTLTLTGWADLNGRIAGLIESSLGSGNIVPGDNAAAAAGQLLDLVEAEHDFLADPEGFRDRLSWAPAALMDGDRTGSMTDHGYLSTNDGRVVFVLVSAALVDSTLEAQRALVDGVREVAAAVLSDRSGIRYGLTGPTAMTVEEMSAIGSDGRRTSLIAIVGVLGISLLVFRRRRHALLGLATLSAGVVWSIGAVRLEIGSLDVITTALVPILVGMGIDYAVHPLSQYELERQQKGRREAVRATLRKTSAAVLASAFTTAAAFACLLLMDFRGFSQLGLVTSVGVLLCLLSSLLVLPALLLLRGAPEHNSETRAAVDQIWDHRAAAWVCASPRLVVLLAVALTAVAGLAATGVELRSSLLELLPAGAESLHYLEVINDESALSHDFNLVVADNLRQLGPAATGPERGQHPSVRFDPHVPARPTAGFGGAGLTCPSDPGWNRGGRGRFQRPPVARIAAATRVRSGQRRGRRLCRRTRSGVGTTGDGPPGGRRRHRAGDSGRSRTAVVLGRVRGRPAPAGTLRIAAVAAGRGYPAADAVVVADRPRRSLRHCRWTLRRLPATRR